MPGKQGSDGVAVDLGDLLEAQLPMVAQLDDLPITLRELIECIA